MTLLFLRFQNVLGASIREQIEESFLKKDELVKLMQWKLMVCLTPQMVFLS